VPFLCWQALPDSFFSRLLAINAQQGRHTPDSLVASSLFARYTSRLRYGFVRTCTFLVVQLPPPNRRWEWRKNELGPSRSQGWHDAHLHG
jgi:hypothetical protein